ncbi:glycosyl transferase [Methylocystis echinoides]|uniref:O-linked N-acetylglucosamine transferase, SPINDLY family protein n=1 Tax=Methylocystis echinoides TaxID=29468 RepID=UPI00343DF899
MLAPATSPEAIAQFFQQETEKARSGQQPLAELFGAAETLSSANQPRLTVELYKIWIAFSDANPLAYMAYFNLAILLRRLDDHAGAINALAECARLEPKFWQARINLGRVFEDSGFLVKALEQWNLAVAGLSGVTAETLKLKLLALQQSGRVLEAAERFDAAEHMLKQAMELRPDLTESTQHWLALRQRQCKWPVAAPSEYVTKRQLLDGMSPISLALFADDPLFQLAKAYRYNKTLVGRPTIRPLRSPAECGETAGERLRIGYVSSDLREHAVGFALVELFELHDRSKFEIFAYYFGDDRPADETQARFKAAVDHWTDIAKLDDDRAAMEIAEDRIDILVDLNGYTKHARAGVFARRPAPVIVNWCGYPGTMGSPYHHYLIADAHIVPPENELYYSEKVLRLACNQPLDRKRKIAWDALTRADEGLPQDAFVFCCLNGMQKITPEMFSLWMTILRETPESVLWLLTGAQAVDDRLRELAAQSGVAPERLLFAQKRPNAQHLARMALADLFLDSFPYGAHSTAADALTAGVPVLTRPGRSFAARFCASVTRAAGLDALVCATFDEYVQKAIAIGSDRGLAQRYRAQLAQGRDASVLRDMNAAARRLEELYCDMRDARDADALPVPDLANLDVYYEIGAELEIERANLLDDAAYFAAYHEKLEEWSRRAPLSPDARLWRR